TDGLPGDGVDVDVGGGGDFAHHEDKAVGDRRLAGDPRHGVASQDGVEDAVRNLVAHFVWVAFGDGLRSEELSFGHNVDRPSVARRGPVYRPPGFAIWRATKSPSSMSEGRARRARLLLPARVQAASSWHLGGLTRLPDGKPSEVPSANTRPLDARAIVAA